MMQEIYQPSNRVFLIRILNSFPTSCSSSLFQTQIAITTFLAPRD